MMCGYYWKRGCGLSEDGNGGERKRVVLGLLGLYLKLKVIGLV